MHACNKISEKEAMSQKESKEGLEGRNVIKAIEKKSKQKNHCEKNGEKQLKERINFVSQFKK